MCIICRKEYNINTKFIKCCENVKKISKKLINLKELYGNETQIKKIPETLTNLKVINYCNTQIKFIPETIKNLKDLYCDDNVLVSPQTYIIEPNNYYYSIFTRCQARYRNKLRLRKLKFAYDPKYIIGHTTKKQLAKLFKN